MFNSRSFLKYNIHTLSIHLQIINYINWEVTLTKHTPLCLNMFCHICIYNIFVNKTYSFHRQSPGPWREEGLKLHSCIWVKSHVCFRWTLTHTGSQLTDVSHRYMSESWIIEENSANYWLLTLDISHFLNFYHGLGVFFKLISEIHNSCNDWGCVCL